MNPINSLLYFRPTKEGSVLSYTDLLLRRAEFALKTGDYVDAKTDALLVINFLNEQRATSLRLMRAFVILLHAQSAGTNMPSHSQEDPPVPHLTVHECHVAASMAHLFATNPRHTLQERCAVYLGLARYYQYLNWQDKELESVTEVQNLCGELGGEGEKILRELYINWPSLAR